MWNEAREWSLMKWLLEKRRVRTTADAAVAAFAAYERDVKATWSDDLRNCYDELVAEASADEDPEMAMDLEYLRQVTQAVDPAVREWARKVKEADDRATEARLTAERTFDEAEHKLNAAIARRGTEEALSSYLLREDAIAAAAEAASVVRT
jgi:hypothetical protein